MDIKRKKKMFQIFPRSLFLNLGSNTSRLVHLRDWIFVRLQWFSTASFTVQRAIPAETPVYSDIQFSYEEMHIRK